MKYLVIFYGWIFFIVFSTTQTWDYSEDLYHQELGSSWFPNDVDNEDRSKAVQELMEFFGINEENVGNGKTVPRFMEGLYKEVADTESGFVKGKTLYDAQIIRSYFEKVNSRDNIFHFDVSNIPMDEFLLQAELHLLKKKMSMESLHPSILASPYHLIRVYQVMDNLSLDVPDFHKLLTIQYVNAHSSGWQIFNVKQAILSWINGEPNLGLMVIGSTLFEDVIKIEFIRKIDNEHVDQPILVLFNDIRDVPDNQFNGKSRTSMENILEMQIRKIPQFFHRQKKKELKISNGDNKPRDSLNTFQESLTRSKRDAIDRSTIFQKKTIISGKSKLEDILTSMNIYERGVFREILQSRTKATPAPRRRRIIKFDKYPKRKLRHSRNIMNCTRQDFRIDFNELGLSTFIISPKVYAVHQCKGFCQYVSRINTKINASTNHAIVQNIMHKIKSRENDIGLPCCVPTKLLDLALLYFERKDQIVLKIYTDMVVDTCGCR